MGKSKNFSTKSVFGQLISLIGDDVINNSVKKTQSDYCTKKFKAKDHLISMLFCAFTKCNLLREVSGAMLGLAGKTANFQLNHIPKRSTLSDANKNRGVKVFEEIYKELYQNYKGFISDSRFSQVLKKEVKIVDSSTIGSVTLVFVNCQVTLPVLLGAGAIK
jgi:hypothetical protein